MARYTKTGTPNTIGQINSELDKISTAIGDTLSRKNDLPNQMEGNLDMNSNRVYNLKDAENLQEPATYSQLLNTVTSSNFEAAAAKFTTTVILAVSDTSLAVGDVVIIKERASGIFDVVLKSGVTPNTYNIIECTGVSSLALVLRENKIIYAEQYTSATDIGAAWNFADARANTEGWPLILPAGNYTSSISLTWDGIFHSITGGGIDLTIITFTEDVVGVTIRGGHIEGFQLVGIGAAATKVGMIINQNQAHVMRRVRVKNFYDNFEFNGGNSSNFDAIFGQGAVRHNWNNTLGTPDNNAITCGMMNFKEAGETSFNFESGVPSNVSQQWKGGIILCQSSNKGFNISGRGHELTFYDEFNATTSTMDSNCKGSQIRMVYGEVTDSGSGNSVILHRVGAAEFMQHQFLQAKIMEVRTHGTTGQFEFEMKTARALTLSEVGSSAASSFNLVSASGPYMDLVVQGTVTGRTTTSVDNATSVSDIKGIQNLILSNTSTTAMNAFAGARTGQTLRLLFTNGNTTITQSTSIRLVGGADFVGSSFDTLTMIWNGADWLELSRSVNA